MSGIPVPEKLSQNLLQFDGDDVAWTLFCGIELLIAWGFSGSGLPVLTVFLIWVVSMLRPGNARLYYTVLVDIPVGVLNRLRHGVQYDVTNRRASIKRVFPHPTIRWFKFENEALPSQGFVELSEGDGFMVAIKGTGTTAAAKDIEIHEAMIESIAAATRSIQGQVALIYQNRPHDPTTEQNLYGNILSPRVVKLPNDVAEQYPRYALQKKTIADTLDYVTTAGSDPSMLLAITVPRQGANKGEDDTWTLQDYRKVFGSAEKYVSQLQAFGVTDAAICSRDDMTRHYRSVWDANTLQAFYKDMQDYLYGEGEYPSHLPRRVLNTKGYMQFDEQNYVAVLEVVRTTGVVDRTRFKKLFGALNKQRQPIWYSLITMGEYADAGSESRVLKRGVPIIEDVEDAILGEQNREFSYEAQERANQNRQRLQEIGFYRNEQMVYVRFLTVHGSDPEDLSDNISTLASLAEDAGFKTRQIVATAPLNRFFASSLGINGV